MDFNWFKMPDDYSRRNQTPYQQVKAMAEAINTYEKILHKELKKVAKCMAEIAMILVNDDYAKKILGESNEENS